MWVIRNEMVGVWPSPKQNASKTKKKMQTTTTIQRRNISSLDQFVLRLLCILSSMIVSHAHALESLHHANHVAQVYI